MTNSWPAHLDVGAVRFARPTANYDAVVTFYRDIVGLPVLAQWRNHSGYDGVVFGLPAVCDRFSDHGQNPVEAANPYWSERGAVMFEDPDGWHVVLAPWAFTVD